MKNIHLISTDKPSRLFYDISLDKLVLATTAETSKWFDNKYVYITSDEEIKDGWSYDRMMKSIGKRDNVYSSKIILTTDQDLIKDSVQAIDDEFLEWFVKNPSCEEVGITFGCMEIRQCMCDSKVRCLNPGYEIIIPQEEPKQETTLEEAAERLYTGIDRQVDRMLFIKGAKWQQKRMYSEEDMREAFKGGSKMCWTDINQETQEPYYYDFNEWFEQFKKK